MKNKKLLPCPFCGGEGYMLHGAFNKDLSSVICKGCAVETRIYRTPDEAIAAWNRRTNAIPVGHGENYEVTHNDR